MTTLYPSQVDTTITLPSAINNATKVDAAAINTLRDAILAIETELGIQPSGVYGTVRNRLDALEAAINSGGSGGGGSFTPGGDLAGNSASQVVIKIHGASVPAAGSLTTGNVLQVVGVAALSYAPINIGGGTNFITGILPAANQSSQTIAGDGSGTTAALTVTKIQNHSIKSVAPTDGQVLTWVAANSDWEPINSSAAKSSSGSYSARPPAIGSGTLYFCDDIPVMYLDDPTSLSWKQYYGSPNLQVPNLASSYIKVGTLFLTQQADAVRAISPNNLANCAFISGAGALGPTSTWVVTLIAEFLPDFNNIYPEMGVVVSTGASTDANAYTMSKWWNDGVPGLHNVIFNPGTTSRSSFNDVLSIHYGKPGRVSTRLLSDGANLHYQISGDDINWEDFITPATTPSGLTHYGFLLGNTGGFTSGIGVSIILRNTLSALTVPVKTVSNATNATPIVITTSTNHNFLDGDKVVVMNVLTNTNANGTFFVHTLTNNTFSLFNTVGNGAYGGGGSVILISR